MIKEGEALKSTGDIADNPRGVMRGTIQYTKNSFELDKPKVVETGRVGFDVDRLKKLIKDKGHTYECHFELEGKVVVFVLDSKTNNTAVFLDNGTTRLPNDDEWVAYHKIFKKDSYPDSNRLEEHGDDE